MTYKRLRSPILWFGGKGNMRAKIVPILENIPHKFYVEPFGGGASILLAKTPVSVETYNDIDNGLYDLFTVLSDEKLFNRFYRRVALLPYHRTFYNNYLKTWKDETCLIERVAKWYLVARMSFSGCFGSSFGTAVTTSCRGMAMTTSKWLSIIDILPEIHERLKRVQIENYDWRVILDRYDTPDTLFYLDPPYVMSTRSSGGYLHEITDLDHDELVTKLLSIKGKAVLSGYPNAIYDRLGWERIDWHTASYAAGRTRASGIQGAGSALKKQARIESVWIKGMSNE